MEQRRIKILIGSTTDPSYPMEKGYLDLGADYEIDFVIERAQVFQKDDVGMGKTVRMNSFKEDLADLKVTLLSLIREKDVHIIRIEDGKGFFPYFIPRGLKLFIDSYFSIALASERVTFI